MLFTEEKQIGRKGLLKHERSFLSEQRNNLSLKYFKEANVIVCTTGATHDHKIQDVLHQLQKCDKLFSALVIDEASLIHVPEMIPLLCLNPKRLWLLGDERQLGPTIHDESAKAAGLDVSWMEFIQLT